jgi:general secretion pathway protein D
VLVVASKEMLPNILRLIKQLDIEKPKDVRVRMLPLEHADSASVSRAIERLFPAKRDQAEKDKVQVISDGTEGAIVVVASDQNYALIKELVGQLDTKNAQKRETRRFELKYLDAQDTADQLSELYGRMKETSSIYSYIYGYDPYGRGRSAKQEVNFVPVAQSNAILVIAPPSEFTLIESLIKELDQPLAKDEVLPEIYRIKNADATQVEKLLNTIFGNAQQGASYEDFYSPYRWRSSAESQTKVGRLAGKVRFSSDTNTNSIIAVSNNKSVYDIVKEIIDEVDRAMPELANTLIIALEHSDAVEMARTLNILFGKPVQPQQRRQQQQPNPSGGTDSGGPGANEEVITGSDFSAWWGQTAQQGREKELPISNLIERVRFVPDPRTNSLLVTTASHNFEVIKGFVKDLDKEEPQVQVKVRIVEIRKEGTRKLGLRWTPAPSLFSAEDLDSAVRVLGGLELIDTFDGGAKGLGSVTGSVLGYNYSKNLGRGEGVIGGNVNMSLLMQLLIRNLDSKVKSDPMLYMSNNKPGELFAGDDVPRLDKTDATPQGGTQSYYKPNRVGVELKITPHINKNKRVVLSVSLVTSRLTGEKRGDSDIIQTRTYNTELAISSGETMVLGGITLDTKQKIVRKVPLLGDIPLLGYLFRNYDTVDSQSDVYVFITPRVVSSEQEAREIAGETLVKFNGKDNGKGSVEDSGNDAKDDSEKSPE